MVLVTAISMILMTLVFTALFAATFRAPGDVDFVGGIVTWRVVFLWMGAMSASSFVILATLLV